MNQTAILEWLPQLQRIGVALVIGFVPALIAPWKRRAMMPWYLYGFACALLAWPAVAPARNIRPHADCRSPELPLVSIAARHTNGALDAINSQRRARAELVAQRQREAEVLTGLKTE
jgi:hypothetical protein